MTTPESRAADHWSAIQKLIARYRSRSLRRRGRRAIGGLLASKPFARLPIEWRRHLADHSTFKVVGDLSERSRGLVTIVSHELGAAGAPKVLVEIIDACRRNGWATVVVAPHDGPYADIFAAHGAFVVVSGEALGALSPAVAFARLSVAIVCNTVVCADLIGHLPMERVAWYLHETGLIDGFRASRPQFSEMLSQVADVWAASPLVTQRISVERPDAFVIGASCPPISRGVGTGGTGAIDAIVLGSIEARKGQDLLVDAYRALPAAIRQRLSISFYGRQMEPAFAQDVIAKIDATPGLRYGGSVSPELAAAALAGADALIVSSRDEPLPLVAIEALSAGKVVICSRAAGIACYLTNGRDGYIATSATVDGLRDVLLRAVGDCNAWAAVGRAGEAIYKSRFSTVLFQRQVTDRLDRIAAGFEGSPPRAPSHPMQWRSSRRP